MEKTKKQLSKKAKNIIISAVSVVIVLCFVFGSLFWDEILWDTKWFKEYSQDADLKITIAVDKTFETFDGWGASACWWSQILGDNENAEEVMKLLYSKEGLGLNIYRYNIGAGSSETEDTKITDPWRKTESFYYYNEETSQYEYDFTRDANAQKCLDMALSYGCVDTVVLFANSPHYTMTKNAQAYGNEEWWVSNIAPNQYEKYAEYFMEITEYFLYEKGLADKGIKVLISPINEPNWSWGVEGNQRQEGCFYNSEDIYGVYKAFAKEIKERNLPVLLSGPESGEIGHRLYEWFEYIYNDAEIRPYLGTLAYHSYWSDDLVNNKIGLGNWLDEKEFNVPIEMSEWCHLPCTAPIDSMDGALLQARVIANDLEYTHANSWTAWVGVNGIGIGDDGKQYSDGLLVATDAEISDYIIPMRYYAMAHYSQFIPVGSTRLYLEKNINDLQEITEVVDGEERIVSSRYTTNAVAYKRPDGKIVCVVVNEGVERKLDFNIDADKMTVYTTTELKQMVQTYSGKVDEIDLPARSIMTVVFE